MGKKDKATQEQSFAAPAPTTASSASSILGPLDVQQKEFRVSRFGGYKMRDVDEFLDRITDSMSALTVEKGGPADKRTLSELNLRGLTGASVLAIARGHGGVIIPTATEALRAGDILALAGTSDAIAAAREILQSG